MSPVRECEFADKDGICLLDDELCISPSPSRLRACLEEKRRRDRALEKEEQAEVSAREHMEAINASRAKMGMPPLPLTFFTEDGPERSGHS